MNTPSAHVFTLSQFRYFLALTEFKTFPEAARQAGTHSRAVSDCLKKLEKNLGIPLVDWKKRRLLDSEPVIVLREESIRILQQWRHDMSDLKSLKALPRNMRIMVPECVSCASSFVKFLDVFRSQFDDWKIDIQEVSREPGPPSVLRNKSDFYITMGEATHPSIQSKVIGVSRMYALLRKDHPLASKSSVSVSEIAEERLAAFDPTSYPGLGGAVDKMFQTAGIENHRFDHLATHSSLLLSMVGEAGYCGICHGLGWTSFGENISPVELNESPAVNVSLCWSNALPSTLQNQLEDAGTRTPIEYVWVQ